MASSSANNEEPGLVCMYCGANMTMYTSHTERNPNRKFWKCHTSKDGVKCRGFFWLDELERNLGCQRDGLQIIERQMSEVKQSLRRFQECQEAMDAKICSIHRDLRERPRCCCIL